MANGAEEVVLIVGHEIGDEIGKEGGICRGDDRWDHISIGIHDAVSCCASADGPPWHNSVLQHAIETWERLQGGADSLKVDIAHVVHSSVGTDLSRAYTNVGVVANGAIDVVIQLRITHVRTADYTQVPVSDTNSSREARTQSKVLKIRADFGFRAVLRLRFSTEIEIAALKFTYHLYHAKRR